MTYLAIRDREHHFACCNTFSGSCEASGRAREQGGGRAAEICAILCQLKYTPSAAERERTGTDTRWRSVEAYRRALESVFDCGPVTALTKKCKVRKHRRDAHCRCCERRTSASLKIRCGRFENAIDEGGNAPAAPQPRGEQRTAGSAVRTPYTSKRDRVRPSGWYFSRDGCVLTLIRWEGRHPRRGKEERRTS